MKKMLTVLMGIVLALSLAGCQKTHKSSEEAVVSDTGFYFDTVVSVQVNHEKGETLLKECFSLCAEYEKIFSRTDSSSELYRLNHRDSSQVTVSQPLADLIRLGLEYGDISGGAFDITVAPLSNLWNFKEEDPVIPDEADIQKALQKVDYRKVHIKDNQVIFDSEDTMIDLGGIVKGWAADQMKRYLVSQGVESALIDLGGNVLTIGKKSDGTPWQVGIQKPFAQRGETITVLDADNCSVVSSGTYERHFEKNGENYHHIIDPATGYPAKTNLSQATIVSSQSVLGDLYSTICILKGYDQGKALVDAAEDITAIFVSGDGALLY